MPYLLSAYNYAQSHSENALGGMISYLIGDQVSTPYSGGWTLSSHFSDANNIEITTIARSFGASNSSTITNMVKSANAHHQTLNFFCFTAYEAAFNLTVAAKVEIANPYTGTTYTTP